MVGKKAKEGGKDKNKRRKKEKEIIFHLNMYVYI